MSRIGIWTQFDLSMLAPGLAIYFATTGNVSVTSTTIEVTVNGTLYSITYVGRTLRDVADQISITSGAAYANPLNNSWPLAAGDLQFDNESAADGSKIIRIKGHTVRYGAETRIRVLPPYPEHRLLPWHPRISRGSVRIEYHGVNYLFTIPEYHDQEWSFLFGKPYVDQVGTRAEFIDSTTLRVPRTPIHWVGQNLGLVVDGIPLGHTVVKDVDVNNGLIKLNIRVDRTQDLRVNYVYREDTLIYKGVDLNPSYNHSPSVIDKTVVLYLRPSYWLGSQMRSTTVRHSVSTTLTGAVGIIPQQSEPILVVGAFQVKPAGHKSDISVVDTRTRGGGIKEKEFDLALDINREAHSVADMGRFDGVPFPGAMSGILTLPRSALTRFSEDYIQSVIQRHLSVGGHVLLDLREGE